MSKKYLYAIIICLTIAFIAIPRSFSNAAQICNYNPEAYQGLEIESLTTELNQTGLIGEIHGAAAVSNLFVLSVREPGNFFAHREFSLIAKNEQASNSLQQLNRHDRVCVKGAIIPNSSPQKHIAVDAVKVVDSWAQPEGFAPYEREAKLPAELSSQDSFIGKVHAIGAEGKILVVEYKDGVIPVSVSDTQYTQDLYRGDIIKVHYQIQGYPSQPTHLQLDTNIAQPLEVLDAIVQWHNQPKTLSGNLVKFPQSPQLKFDVYAMEVDTQGIKRYFTLINFQDMDKFTQIRTKLADIWNANAETAISGRNLLINPQVQIEATGIINLISTEQANPQILLDNAEAVNPIS